MPPIFGLTGRRPAFRRNQLHWRRLERATGFEPATSGLENQSSTAELRPRKDSSSWSQGQGHRSTRSAQQLTTPTRKNGGSGEI